MKTDTHPNAELAAIVRECRHKKELVAHGLKGERLATAWAWVQKRAARAAARAHPETVPISEYRRRKLKPEFRDKPRMQAGHYWLPWKKQFSARRSKEVRALWPIKSDKGYSVSVWHRPIFSKRERGLACSRPACSYETMDVRIGYDLLREEVVVIGGLLTIRLKADRDKPEYPCAWIQRHDRSPGVYLTQGILRDAQSDHPHHFDPTEETRRKLKNAEAQIRRAGKRVPTGWVTAAASTAAGNCAAGTRIFVMVVHHALRSEGYSVVKMDGVAVTNILALRIGSERNVSSYVRRVIDWVERENQKKRWKTPTRRRAAA